MNLKNYFTHIISTCFYLGYVKVLPGTLTSFVSLIIFSRILVFLNIQGYLILTLFFFIFSIIFCHLANKFVFEENDSQKIVLDESFGILVSLYPYFYFKSDFLDIDKKLYLLLFYILCFLFFRFFDILKPYPISYIDEKWNSGFSIVADDALAGIFAGTLVYFIFLWIL